MARFLKSFYENSYDFEELLEFLSDFEATIMDEYVEYGNSIYDLAFGASVAKNFYIKLEEWYKNNDFDRDKIKEIINNTRKDIALEFLHKVNE